STALERPLRKRVPEAVECPFLLRRPDPSNLRRSQCRVEVTSQHDGRRQEALTIRAGKNQVIVRAAITQARKELDHVGNGIDISSLAVLRRTERAPRIARANAYDGLFKIDISPAKCEQFSLPHSGLQR